MSETIYPTGYCALCLKSKSDCTCLEDSFKLLKSKPWLAMSKIRTTMKVTEDELLKFSAELLTKYNIPLEFEKDGIYLQENIDKVCKELNIHVISKSFYCDCKIPKLINITSNCRCEQCGRKPNKTKQR